MDRSLQIDPEDQNGAGHAYDEDVQTGEHTDPEVDLKEGASQEDALRPMDERLHRPAPALCRIEQNVLRDGKQLVSLQRTEAVHPEDFLNSDSVAAAPLELIFFVREQHVETRQRPVTAADVALQLHLQIIRQVSSVDLLLERAETIPQHHDLVKERLDRPALFLQARRAGAKHERAAAPLLGRHSRRQAGLLPDDSPKQQLEVA